MSQPQSPVNTKPAIQLLKGQVMAVLVVMLLALHWGVKASISAGVGATIAVVGSAYLAWQAFRYHGGDEPKLALRAFYRGIFGKLILIMLGFLLAFRSPYPLSAGALFIGFAAVQFLAWVYPLILAQRDEQS